MLPSDCELPSKRLHCHVLTARQHADTNIPSPHPLGGGVGGVGRGSVWQDLREAYLHLEGKMGASRDAQAAQFDQQLLRMKATAPVS